ncbi:hypothetical protein M231_04145 [Tremella mesenterica]|uniref:Uncharacterized protein n=1 Tax=Tremella mesenterica TaxID=5217 RepID=A0A4Q1BLG5_TREME|nr:hypothetical protein M231_04145 [Tremella mesenterica]
MAHGLASPIKMKERIPKGISGQTQIATDTLCLTDLHWWTTQVHLLQAAYEAGVILRRDDITTTEHKVNGKTKGTVFLCCHSTTNAIKLFEWFRLNVFQGKRLSPTFVPGNAAQIHKIPAGQPLISTVLATHPPTNAHGGINFNRLRPHSRIQIQQAMGLGLGRPTAPRDGGRGLYDRFTKSEYNRGWPHDSEGEFHNRAYLTSDGTMRTRHIGGDSGLAY